MLTGISYAQTALRGTNYFIDGYHGGIYGHYPLWVTKFIADSMDNHPDWRVNLEIEPLTWDIVAEKDPKNYMRIKELINTPSTDARVEYVNPSYGQSYLYNISIESIIHQFQFGIKKIKSHFPLIRFTTYSSEEPCFTSALPQVLKSLGIKYVSLKNPNTCWGGYVSAYGGQFINWVGPEGTSLLTVPRYSSESLVNNSTWQTIAWDQSQTFLNAAFNQGIDNPVGMCLQDAGWKNGPWLGNHKSDSTSYSTWRNYFINFGLNKNVESWKLTQEDIHVSLVWGAQVLQQISKQIRSAEHNLRAAEKLASLATIYRKVPYPKEQLDKAWENILLSQHHDCWIVPYNKMGNLTWAEHVRNWTSASIEISNKVINASVLAFSGDKEESGDESIVIFNPTNFKRKESVTATLPKKNGQKTSITLKGKNIPYQILNQTDSNYTVLFIAEVLPLSNTIYKIEYEKEEKMKPLKGAGIKITYSGDYLMESDLYQLVIDGKTGAISQLKQKKSGRQFVIENPSNYFNTFRGYFFNKEKWITSYEEQPKITILEDGPLRAKLKITGKIDTNIFTQIIQLTKGSKLIDFELNIDYASKTGIGDPYKQNKGYDPREYRKAFYNDTSKLAIRFPLNIQNQKLYKDAPLDVTESKLKNTFFNSWDGIKNNIIFNWVDIIDSVDNYGIALLSDHVTSYSYGINFPLSLTAQYAGIGLWGRNYNVNGPTTLRYALLPHEGNWLSGNINQETTKWNEPLVVKTKTNRSRGFQLLKKIDVGLEISTMYFEGNDLVIRILNNNSKKLNHEVSLDCFAESIDFIELNNAVSKSIKLNNSRPVSLSCDIPLFGFKTVRINGIRSNKENSNQ